jgi:adenylosuccinate synthase
MTVLLQRHTGLIEKEETEATSYSNSQQEEYGTEDHGIGSRRFERYRKMQAPVNQLKKLSEKHGNDRQYKFENVKNEDDDEFTKVKQNDDKTFEFIHALKYNPPL